MEPLRVTQELSGKLYGNVRLNQGVIINSDPPSVVISANTHGANLASVVLDRDIFNSFYVNGTNTFHVNGSGYVAYGNGNYLHDFVWELSDRPPKSPGQSIDHIGRIKTDNRLANLRLATQSEQNANRGIRADKKPMPDAIQSDYPSIGNELPRYIRYDPSEERFSFIDHPKYRRLFLDGHPVPSPNGSKAAGLRMAEKLQDCLVGYIKTLDMYNQVYMANDNELLHISTLRRQFQDIVEVAHAHNPALFPMNDITVEIESELDTAHRLVQMLPAPSADAKGAPKRVGQAVVSNDVCKVSGSNGGDVMYDATYAPVLSQFSWSASEPRIKIPRSKTALNSALSRLGLGAIPPSLNEQKLQVAQFVAEVLLQRSVPEGHVVVPINHIRADVRVANLAIAEGEGKNFRMPVSIRWPAELADPTLGEVIPRGLNVSVDGKSGGWLLTFDCAVKNIKRKLLPIVKNAKDAAERVAEYEKIIMTDWPLQSPFRKLVMPLDPRAVEAFKEWKTANAYYVEMVTSSM